MPDTLTLHTLLTAVSPGGPSCLTSTTELAAAAGPHASVAPAKFASARSDKGTFAYERRYLDGRLTDAVVIDSKQSQLNRVEQALRETIEDGHETLTRMPRITVRYQLGQEVIEYADIQLPHRAFDGHIRAGTVQGTPVTDLETYRKIRDAHPGNARPLFDASPASMAFGSWDSSRAARQGRWRSLLVGEIIGFCAEHDVPALKGGARIDPLGMKIELTGPALKALVEQQRSELSKATYDKVVKDAGKAKSGERVKSSAVGLGGIPPKLETLAGVACYRIVRSHVLTFAGLRQIRFNAGRQGDTACRALLAALALNGLARSDAELVLRANCDLIEAAPTEVTIDQRGGRTAHLAALTIDAADTLLADALTHAEQVAGVVWQGPVLRIEGNPAIAAGALDEDSSEEA